jgi:hypothetical protein
VLGLLREGTLCLPEFGAAAFELGAEALELAGQGLELARVRAFERGTVLRCGHEPGAQLLGVGLRVLERVARGRDLGVERGRAPLLRGQLGAGGLHIGGQLALLIGELGADARDVELGTGAQRVELELERRGVSDRVRGLLHACGQLAQLAGARRQRLHVQRERRCGHRDRALVRVGWLDRWQQPVFAQPLAHADLPRGTPGASCARNDRVWTAERPA